MQHNVHAPLPNVSVGDHSSTLSINHWLKEERKKSNGIQCSVSVMHGSSWTAGAKMCCNFIPQGFNCMTRRLIETLQYQQDFESVQENDIKCAPTRCGTDSVRSHFNPHVCHCASLRGIYLSPHVWYSRVWNTLSYRHASQMFCLVLGEDNRCGGQISLRWKVVSAQWCINKLRTKQRAHLERKTLFFIFWGKQKIFMPKNKHGERVQTKLLHS